MKYKTPLILLFIILTVLLLSSLNANNKKANKLLKQASSAIKEYNAIEQDYISPQMKTISQTEGSKDDAKKSLTLIRQILHHVDSQFTLIKKAKTYMNTINTLDVNSDIKQYCKLTNRALDADLENLKISQKLYLELRKMYTLITQNNLNDDIYQNITGNVNYLTKRLSSTSNRQHLRHNAKDIYYQKYFHNN